MFLNCFIKLTKTIMIMSVDIGLKNLSLCIASCTDPKNFNTYSLHLWDIYDILEDDNHLCKSIQKNKKSCEKKCTFKYKSETDEHIYTCKKHFPKDIKIEKSNNYKQKLIKDYLLQDIVKAVITKINEIYNDNIELFTQLKTIIIELQPSVNSSMKMISHVIYGKLTDLLMETNTVIKFVRASQKLKAYTGPEIICKLKGAYPRRKWFSIQYVIWFLENKFSIEEKDKWLPFLNSKSKQCDLSDTFLMIINGLHGIPKKQKMNFKKVNMK